MRRRGKDRYGTPTGEPVPQGIDDYTGFKVPLADLKKDWAGLYAVDPDRRNPQDFVRGVKDLSNLPFARPESEEISVALPIFWQSGAIMTSQRGRVLLTEGIDPLDTL